MAAVIVTVAPSGSSIHLIGVEDDQLMYNKVDFWTDVYGIATDPHQT